MCPDESELSEENIQLRGISFEVIPNAGGLTMNLDLNVKCPNKKNENASIFPIK